MSAAGGVDKAPLRAAEIGANALALFTKNQRQWTAKPLEEETIEAFRKNCQQAGFSPEQILPHDSYLINLAHPERDKREKSLQAFEDEAARVESLGLLYLNFHPGSVLKGGDPEKGIAAVAESLNRAMAKYRRFIPVIETTAGQGSNLGRRFEELAAIIDQVDDKARIGVCIDTCHIMAAGYDIRSAQGYRAVMEEFGGTVGFSYLKGLHLNDAKSEFASRVDRHAPLGAGNLGWEPFRSIMRDPRLEGIPLVLETPKPELWAEELRSLREMERTD